MPNHLFLPILCELYSPGYNYCELYSGDISGLLVPKQVDAKQLVCILVLYTTLMLTLKTLKALRILFFNSSGCFQEYLLFVLVAVKRNSRAV